MRQVRFGRALALRLVVVATLVVLATLQLAATPLPAAAQGTATIEITNTDAGTGQPAPFTRFQVTSENGTVYGPLETDLSGYVAFSVTVDPQGTSFTIAEETPPACATAPDPQTTDPLQAGDSTSLTFSTQDNPGCGLGTIALYAMSCPDGFSGPADDYDPWRDGCTGTNDGTGFTLTSADTGQAWNPVAGAYGIPGRAPIVGLPAGDYTFQQDGDTPSAVFCLVYDTANYATSPEPSSVLPVSLENGVGTISLDGNRVSCDVFTIPGGAVVPPADTTPVQPASSSGSSLELHAALCPAGTDPDSDLYTACHGNGLGGIQISIYSSSSDFSDEQTTTVPTTPGPGIATWTGLAAGGYAIGIDGYDPAISIEPYCSIADSDTVLDFDISLVSAGISLDLPMNSGVVCDLYFLPPDPSGTSLQLSAFYCPDGLAASSETLLSEFREQCTPATGGAWYTLKRTGEIGVSRTPDEDSAGVVVFDGLPGGDYQLRTSIPGHDNTPWVFCGLAGGELTPYGNGSGVNVLPIDASQGAYACEWYNVPENFGDAPPTGTSSLEVHALLCPDGTDPTGDLYDTCHANGIDGVTYSLSGPDGSSGQQTTTVPASPGPGVAIFDDLAGGTYTVTQQNADPDSILTMYCSLADADDVVPFTQVDDDTISFDLPDDTGVVCDFYTIPPTGQTTTLQVTSYRCPSNMVADDTWTRDDFLAVCNPSPATTQLTLTPDGGGEGVTLTTGSTGVGTVLFEGLPTGVFSLGTSIPGDFNTPYLFCGLEGGALDPTNFTIDIDASLGTYVCQLFNDGENASGYSDTLTVTNFLCPPGTTSDYADRCGGSPLTGGNFLLDRDGWKEIGSISDDGAAMVFEHLIPGDYQLTAQPPSNTNIAVYVVSCEAGGTDLTFDYDDSNGMSIAFQLRGGVDIECNWYNIPPSPPTVSPGQSAGSITVRKFLCQGKSVNAYNWDADCAAETQPVGFALKTSDGRPIAIGTTDNNGMLTYTGLANGAYSLDETSGDWCHAEADRVDSAGNVLVANGGNTDVFIYNCSLKQVGSLPSTGTGADRASAADFDLDKLAQLVLAAGATLGIALAMRHQLQRAAMQTSDQIEDPLRTGGDEPAPS